MSKTKRGGRRKGASHWETRAQGVVNAARSAAQEQRTATALGARQTKASGATAHDKSDAVGHNWRFEMKQTGGKSLSAVKASHVEKIWREAHAKGQEPAVVITMEAIEEPVQKDWVLIDLNTFRELTGEGIE